MEKNNRIDALKMRQKFVDRVYNDFTYKPGTPEQRGLWSDIEKHFAEFRSSVEETINEITDAQGFATGYLRSTEEYKDYRSEVRNAEQWFATAVANDYDPDADDQDTRVLEYQGSIEGQPQTRVYYCEMLNLLCFTLSVTLAQFIPQGRALSIAETAMQEVRGDLMDLVNRHWR